MTSTIINAAMRRLEAMFPGYFDEAKHNHYADFGWPVSVSQQMLFQAYRRNSLARAAVNKTTRKVWQTRPQVVSGGGESTLDKELAEKFERLRLWQKMAETERRYLVTGYSGLILRIADGGKFNEPVVQASGGLDALVEVIPAWSTQLTVAEWHDDENSEEYGTPRMFSFNEAAMGGKSSTNRTFNVHPDRVLIWSGDGTVNGTSLLEAGYNDLMTMEKVSGSGGEGFWKNAKSSPVLQVDKDAKLSRMAAAMGVAENELLEAMNDQTEAWQKGFDKLLMLQGMEAKTLQVELPDPENFHGTPLQTFAASVEMPVKVLVGMQTGERASTEDAKEWAQTCMGRRSDVTIPNIQLFMRRLVSFGIVPDVTWDVEWADLTANTVEQMIDRVVKMSSANQQNGDEPIFSVDEMREMGGMKGAGPKPILDDEEEEETFNA